MTRNEKKFILENRQYYIDDFVKYWLHYYDYVPDCEKDIREEFKAFMWDWKNIDYVDFRWPVFKTIVNEAVSIIIEKLGEKTVSYYEQDGVLIPFVEEFKQK